MANPDRTQGECAKEMKVTEPWLSRVINSDMFQALYQEICEERKVAAVHSISNKMTHAASLVLDRTIERLEMERTSEHFLISTSKNLLGSLGFNGGAAAAEPADHRHLHLHLTPKDIIDARERARVVNGEERG